MLRLLSASASSFDSLGVHSMSSLVPVARMRAASSIATTHNGKRLVMRWLRA